MHKKGRYLNIKHFFRFFFVSLINLCLKNCNIPFFLLLLFILYTFIYFYIYFLHGWLPCNMRELKKKKTYENKFFAFFIFLFLLWQLYFFSRGHTSSNWKIKLKKNIWNNSRLTEIITKFLKTDRSFKQKNVFNILLERKLIAASLI